MQHIVYILKIDITLIIQKLKMLGIFRILENRLISIGRADLAKLINQQQLQLKKGKFHPEILQ